ncbi:MAG: hypothetical protein WC340_11945 [Kiritimatiellia bacterium]
MKKKPLVPYKFVIILFFLVSNYSNGSEHRILNPTEEEASVSNLPNPYVLNGCTLTEALDSFFKWYKTAYPPMEQTISVALASSGSKSNEKRMVDLSDTGMDPFSDNQIPEYKIKRTIDLSGIHVDDVIPRIASAYGLISHFYNGIYHINDSEIATRGVAAGAEQKLSPSNYLTSFLASNIVAAVVGYETTRQLAGGVTVPLFSVELSSSAKSIDGILFKIIAPSRYADQFFWIKNTTYDEWTLPTNLYNANLLYSFKLDTKPGMFGYISESEFFSIPARKHFSSTTWSKGVPFIKDTNDVMIVRTYIDQHVMALSNAVEQSFARLKLIKKDTEEYNIEKKMYEIDVKEFEMARERCKELLKNANERLESNQQFLKLLFPMG